MYFKTKRETETGLKFKAIEEKRNVVEKELDSIISKYGASGACYDRWAAYGGLEILIFDEEPNMKLWKKSNEIRNGYKPRLTSKEGKAIDADFKSVSSISKQEVNMCIGFKECMFKTIGYSFNNEEYFLFQVGDEWNVEIPSDCTEITATEYKTLCAS